MATRQYQPGSIEAQRSERRRRAKRRKKRIRALLLLVLLVAVIVLVILAFASCHNKDNGSVGISGADAQIEATAEPTAEPAVPTAVSANGNPLPIPSADEENDLLKIVMNIDAQGAEKTAYLTFDDGPSPNVTPAILDILRRYNVKATFFMLGTSINSYPDLARRVYEEGHLLANHSNGHNYETLYASEESFMSEVMQTEDAISKITNNDHNFRLFRFPGGSFNSGDHAADKQLYKRTLALNSFYYIDWNSLTGDSEGRTKTPPELLAYLQRYIDTDSSTVILMHDAAAKTATAEGLASIIEYLISEGYVFKRLDEMPYIPSAYTDPSAQDEGTYNYENPLDNSGSGYGSGSYGSSSNTDSNSSGSDNSYSSSAYIDSSYASGSTAGSSDNGLSGDGSIISTSPPGSTTRTSVNGTTVTENSGGGTGTGYGN